MSGWSCNRRRSLWIATSLPLWFIWTYHLASTSMAFLMASPFRQRRRQRSPRLVAAAMAATIRSNDFLAALAEYGFDGRVLNLCDANLPVACETYINGTAWIGHIAAFDKGKVTFVADETSNNTTAILDLSMVTTVWDQYKVRDDQNVAAASSSCKFPTAKAVEQALDQLYHRRRGQARSSTTLNKKQLLSFPEPIATTLRVCLKTGVGFRRLVDSHDVGRALHVSDHRARAARVLAHDAHVAGRFKRWPCLYLHDNMIVNGGWTVTDQSVRAGTEARQLVQQHQNIIQIDNGRPPRVTAADARILQCLEGVAMGQVFGLHHTLVQGARDTLHQLNLPHTPDGARAALVQLGHWSAQQDLSAIEPWPHHVLEAAAWYVQQQQHHEANEITEAAGGRVDVTMFPAVSIDATRAAFLDDAIGIRPRAVTGRPLQANASKWEIMVHVTDVSDIFCVPNNDDIRPAGAAAPREMLQVLRQAAQQRGSSRYDLPLGALHMWPLNVMQALSLRSRRSRPQTNATRHRRCVTVWAYIDEATGAVVDAGVERTWVAAPTALSFDIATNLMATNADQLSPARQQSRALMLVTERILRAWSQNAPKKHKRGTNNPSAEYQVTRAHEIVDRALDLYSSIAYKLIKAAKAPLPIPAGASPAAGGRVGTGPLRRYVDGVTQQQLLAVLCNYGRPLTQEECRAAGETANDAQSATFRLLRRNKADV